MPAQGGPKMQRQGMGDQGRRNRATIPPFVRLICFAAGPVREQRFVNSPAAATAAGVCGWPSPCLQVVGAVRASLGTGPCGRGSGRLGSGTGVCDARAGRLVSVFGGGLGKVEEQEGWGGECRDITQAEIKAFPVTIVPRALLAADRGTTETTAVLKTCACLGFHLAQKRGKDGEIFSNAGFS